MATAQEFKEETETYDPLPETLHDCAGALKARSSAAEVSAETGSEIEAGLWACIEGGRNPRAPMGCRKRSAGRGNDDWAGVQVRSTWRTRGRVRWWMEASVAVLGCSTGSRWRAELARGGREQKAAEGSPNNGVVT